MFKKMCHQTLNTRTFVALNTVKSLKFLHGIFLQMNGFHKIKYSANVFAVHCNNVTTENP